ncbi:MAG: alcohol dehydrogenase catalytic domain-containing protein [Desulfobacterales bacterium]|jgi:threonine dehydrogenase-like Zn-dependent dehydrogenase|nr:alcohol dehydrogenase catalytic domain-containing protein [Desulfobacterales bacterium]
MRAVWLENQILSYRDGLPQPEPLAGEALVKVRLAGICGTDLELVKGYYPFSGIPGHEFVGEIVKAPAEPHREGQRVVGQINITCGRCPACLAARPTHCEKRSVLGIKDRYGAFADYLCLPMKNLIAVPDSVSDDAAVFTEPLAAALEIQEQIRVRSPDRVLVLGAGRLGQLIAQSLVPVDCDLMIVARYKNQQALLASRQIAWIEEHAVRRQAFDIVIEATGSAEGLVLAQRAVRPRGTIVLKSTYTEKENLQINFSSLVVDEITLVGSRCGPFAAALDQLENRLVDPTVLIEKHYYLREASAAFRQAAQPGVLKILFRVAE